MRRLLKPLSATLQVGYDIFEHMAAKDLHYGYSVMQVDYPSKTLGLWDFAADYVQTHFDAQQIALLEANGFWGNHSFAAPAKESFPMVYNEFEVRSRDPRVGTCLQAPAVQPASPAHCC